MKKKNEKSVAPPPPHTWITHQKKGKGENAVNLHRMEAERTMQNTKRVKHRVYRALVILSTSETHSLHQTINTSTYRSQVSMAKPKLNRKHETKTESIDRTTTELGHAFD